MIKKSLYLSLFFIIFSTVVSFPSYALFNQDLNKAKEFMQVNMYPEAIEQIKKRINESPTDGEAHYLLGQCYLQIKQYQSAIESFDRVLKIKPNLAENIATELYAYGKKALSVGDIIPAQTLCIAAMKFKPSLKNEIAISFYNAGTVRYRNGQQNFRDFFRVATSMYSEYEADNPDFLLAKGDYYFDLNDFASAKKCYEYLMAKNFSEPINTKCKIFKNSEFEWLIYFFNSEPISINVPSNKFIGFLPFSPSDITEFTHNKITVKRIAKVQIKHGNFDWLPAFMCSTTDACFRPNDGNIYLRSEKGGKIIVKFANR